MQAGPASPLESPETGPSIETSVAVGERPELGRPSVLRRPPPIRQPPPNALLDFLLRPQGRVHGVWQDNVQFEYRVLHAVEILS